MAQIINVKTSGAFLAEYCLRWNKGQGQTGWSGNKATGDSATFDMKELEVPEGTSVWAVAAVMGGPTNKESGDNVTVSYDGTTCTYSCGGTSLMPSFSLDCG
jgi:hypothetical protein